MDADVLVLDDPSEIRLTNTSVGTYATIDAGALKPANFVPADE